MGVPCVRVDRTDGEATRRRLADLDLLTEEYDVSVAEGSIYIPVSEPEAVPPDLTVVNHDAPARETQTLPGDVLNWEPSYERLGDLAIIDEDDPVTAESIAEALMTSDLPIEGVLNRASKIKGQTRTRDWEVLRGDRTQTVHREYGSEFALDLESVYFSPRLATERHRVIEQVQNGEQVFDMFAGVGPYAIPMARQGAQVVATDVNETAIEYLRENAERNGMEKRISAIAADVREIAPEYEGWADRIVMNLPHSAGEFLETAVVLAGDSARIHYYDIQHESAPFEPGEEAIRAVAEPEYEVHVAIKREVRTYAPHELNVALDVDLLRA
ncbi:MAG: class I SAM-dependent methyltransferase [Halodesulfurarchaeum sp.]